MPISDYSVTFGTENDEIFGKRGTADFIHGGAGDDVLKGGGRSDMLVDGAGIDKLYGGKGRDIFSFLSDGDQDKIMDFQNGKDFIDLSRLGVQSFDEVVIRKKAGGVMIKAGGEKIFVKDAKKVQFDTDDFIFADQPMIGFDELASDSGRGGSINELFPDGYEGFHITNISFLETDEMDAMTSSGYIPSSGDNVVYNDGSRNTGIYRDIPFDLESAMFSAGWRNDLNVVATAYLGDEMVGSQMFTVGTNSPEKIEFDDDIFDYVTGVEFNSFGGVVDPDTSGNWTQFSMDDLLLIG